MEPGPVGRPPLYLEEPVSLRGAAVFEAARRAWLEKSWIVLKCDLKEPFSCLLKYQRKAWEVGLNPVSDWNLKMVGEKFGGERKFNYGRNGFEGCGL